MLPKPAKIYREQIVAGLSGNPEAIARARSILRELIGVVMIKADGDQLWCEFQMRPDVLLRTADREVRGRRFKPSRIGWVSSMVPTREQRLRELELASVR